MLPAYLLSLREGLEAALVIGILLGALHQMGQRGSSTSVWAGAGVAALLSFAAAILLTLLGLELKDPAEAIFEGLAMLLAGGLLTWMIFWMRHRAGTLRRDLESGVQHASRSGNWSLFGLAFLAVLREGVELALFLIAAALTSSAWQTLVGASLGLGTAALLGWSLFATTARLDLRRFFAVTGVLLVFFAAGLMAHSVHEFNELGWIPPVIAHVWDFNRILNDRSTLGQALAALFGYNASPSLTEILAYALYLGAVLLGLLRTSRRSASAAQPQA